MPARRILSRIINQSILQFVGTENTFDIVRVDDIEYLQVVLTGTLNVTVAGASIPADCPTQLIKRIDFLANGREVLSSVPFVFDVTGNYQRRFQEERTPISATGIASYNFRAVGFLDRINFDGPRPKDSAFQAYLTNLLQLRFVFGNIVDIFVGGTSALTALNLEVLAHRINEVPDAKGQIDKGESKLVKKRTYQSFVLPNAANANLRIPLPYGNWGRCVVLRAQEGATLAPSDALINNVSIAINDVDVRSLSSFLGLKSKNRADKQVVPPTGFAVVDSAPDGKATNFWDMRINGNPGVTKAELVIDHNAPAGAQGKIELMYEEFIIPEQKKAA